MSQQLSWHTNGYSNIQKSPLYTTQSGNFGGGNFYSQASSGHLWSGTTNSGTYAYYLNYFSSYVSPAYSYYRQTGFPVRCINRDFNFLLVQYGIAVNYVGVVSNATWATSGYDDMQNDPLYIPRSGCFTTGGSFYGRASGGYLWSGTTYSDTNAFNLDFGSSYVSPASNGYRLLGLPVRCIAPTFFYSSDFGYLLVEQGITSSFGTAGEKLNWNTNGYSNIQSSPIYSTRSGRFLGGSFNSQASLGFLWSDTTNSDTHAHDLYYNSSNVYPADNDNRHNGFPVRCIAPTFSVLPISATY